MNFGDLLFALNCDPLKNEIRKIEKINSGLFKLKIVFILIKYALKRDFTPNFLLYIYIYTTILPWSCTDGRYFYQISGTALFSGTNFGFFGSIVIFLLYFGYTKSNFKQSL